MLDVLKVVSDAVWGIPALVLILGVGIILTLRTGFPQVTLFPKALASFVGQFGGRRKNSGVSQYQALCTALAATVGTGNVAGVAGAIALGGPGAIFWMWICAFFGMVTKFAEATLAIRYRMKDRAGEYFGGPMYYIQSLGKKWRWLACLYCFFGIMAAFGVGNATQINAVVTGIHSTVDALCGCASKQLDIVVTILLSVVIVSMLLGGARRIGTIAERLVPFAAAAYLLLGFGVLILRWQALPACFHMIFRGAFSPKAVTGGIVGSIFTSLRVGASRGVFTNEAGMGTAAIAHAAADVEHPVQQGMMGIMEVFWDTIVICTMTALVILVSGIPIPYGMDVGAALTAEAFSSVYGTWATVALSLALCCFALATVLGWGLYGMRCAQYLFGVKYWKVFVFLQGFIVLVGGLLQTGTVWLLSEIVNGVMAIPNLIALIALTPELVRLTSRYKQQQWQKVATGGTYENIHQCKSL